jgi:hypothetical protein
MRKTMRTRTHDVLALLAMAMLIATLPACSKKEGCTDPTATNYDADAEDDCCCEFAAVVDPNKVNVTQNIATNTTWTSDKTYVLYGFIEVESGAVLTIEPGTLVRGDKDSKGTLIINRGAKIMADGTTAEPIVFTSNKAPGDRQPGDWGGLIICGKSTVNVPGGTSVVEGGVEAAYGGTDPADNSGVLRYVRIEFPGIPFQPNQEINGLTLAGVGSQTVVEHVQVSYSGDDSFEMFGGTVNVKHLVAFGGFDDDFDMDNGYSGKGQFLVVLRDPNQADGGGSNGLEHDNDGAGTTATPFTTPVLSNVSVFGPLATPGTSFNANYKRAAHLRRNTRTRLFNSVLAAFPTGLYLDDASTEANALAGDLKVENCVFAAMTTLTQVDDGSSFDINTWFTANGNTALDNNGDMGVVDAFNLTNPNMTLSNGSVLSTGASFADTDLTDMFFTNVPYKGAFGDTDWTSGWANWDPQNTVY